MWLLTLRDLQYRRLRVFVVVTLAAVVMALLFLMTGLVNQLEQEPYDTTAAIGGNDWVLAAGVDGPFTSAGTLPSSAADALPGLTPVVVSRGTLTAEGDASGDQVVIVGGPLDALATTMGAPRLTSGRAVQADGEVVVDETSGLHVGDRASLGPLSVEVVGLTKDTTMFAGLPVVFTALDAAQDLTFHSRDLVSAFLTDAVPTTVPDGVAVHSASDVAADALSPLGNAISSIDLVRALLWFVTAVIIGAVVFLSALERQRDFAILRAMGTPRRTLLIGVATEAALIALAAAVVAYVLHWAMIPLFPLPVPRPGAGAVADPTRCRGRRPDRRGVRIAQGGHSRPGEHVRGEVVAGLAIRDLVVEYTGNGYAVRPIDGLSVQADPGELVVLLGPSGSGKTTLLSCLGGILRPTSGQVHVDGVDVTGLAGADMETYRRDKVGFVFQAFNLIPSLSARENVAVPLLLAGSGRRDALAAADEGLDRVGLAERADHKPAALSGGQQQRVAIARGLVGRPPLVLADEPTANLDYIAAEAIIGILRGLRDAGRVIVIATHDARLIPIADRVVRLAEDVGGADAEPVTLTFARGETLFRQGDRSDLVYVVEVGTLDVVRVMADGSEQPLGQVGPRDYVGELGPMLGFPRSATVRAATDVKVTGYGVRQFRQLVRERQLPRHTDRG